VFYLLYGPVEVALPVHVATGLHGSAALLGTFWAAFGVGAVIWGPWTSLLILASPLGTALGGLIVAALGVRGTLLASALATIALGLVTVAALARARSATRTSGTTRKPGTSG
jgi:hypothetical protein